MCDPSEVHRSIAQYRSKAHNYLTSLHSSKFDEGSTGRLRFTAVEGQRFSVVYIRSDFFLKVTWVLSTKYLAKSS